MAMGTLGNEVGGRRWRNWRDSTAAAAAGAAGDGGENELHGMQYNELRYDGSALRDILYVAAEQRGCRQNPGNANVKS